MIRIEFMIKSFRAIVLILLLSTAAVGLIATTGSGQQTAELGKHFAKTETMIEAWASVQ